MNTFGPLSLLVMLVPMFLLGRVRPALPWRSAYLPTLDGWRAIACTLVILDHTSRGLGIQEPSALIHGQHGVNLFFGLSGLLITTKLIEERQQTGGISLAGFYRRRVFRLYPAAFVFLTVVAFLWGFGYVPLKPMDFTSCVFYFRNFVDLPGSMATSHFWSLAIEEQFYLVVPGLFLLLGMRRFQWLLTVGIATSAFLRWFYFRVHPEASFLLGFRTERRVDGLLAGCLMAIVLSDDRARAWLKRMLRLPVWLIMLLGLLWSIHRNGESTTLTESLIIPLLLAGTVLRHETWVARLLEWRPLRWIGRISYSLYLWQQLFALAAADRQPVSYLQQFPLNVVAIFACAAGSYYLVERPLLKWASQVPTNGCASPEAARA